jgi:hypothetical protein
LRGRRPLEREGKSNAPTSPNLGMDLGRFGLSGCGTVNRLINPKILVDGFGKETLMDYDVPKLFSMSQAQLDELFTASPPGDIPNGEAKGTAIIAPGTVFTQSIAEMINLFGWQGKVFDAQKGLLKNRITAFGFEAIVARVYKAPSWLDQKDCIVLDYSDTSIVAHYVRDEIRLIGPGFYLGKVYWERARLIDFCLQF